MAAKMLSIEERPAFYERLCGSIACIRDETSALIGGGVFIEINGKKFVLTAAHVVAAKNHLQVISYDKTSYNVRLQHLDEIRDVALLEVLQSDDKFGCASFCEADNLIRGSEIHLIGHPGRQSFAYNIGNISSAEKTCASIYRALNLDRASQSTRRELLSSRINECVDDFRKVGESVRLVQAKNLHGGGRYGGTGAPFLDSEGNIVGLYSFNFQEEDHAIHFAEVRASIASYHQKADKSKGKRKTRKSKKLE